MLFQGQYQCSRPEDSREDVRLHVVRWGTRCRWHGVINVEMALPSFDLLVGSRSDGSGYKVDMRSKASVHRDRSSAIDDEM